MDGNSLIPTKQQYDRHINGETGVDEKQESIAENENIKKYKLSEGINGMHRIIALIDIPECHVMAGEFGGLIQSEKNLSHSGDAWVSGDAQVYGNAIVSDNAQVFGRAQVFDRAQVSGNARVYGDAVVHDFAMVSDNAWVSDNSWIFGNAIVSGGARVFEEAMVDGNALVFDDACVFGNAKVSGDAKVFSNAWVFGDACVFGNLEISCTNDILTIGPIGSRDKTLTIALRADYYCTGCFVGTKKEFIKRIKKSYTKDQAFYKDYMAAIKFSDVLKYGGAS